MSLRIDETPIEEYSHALRAREERRTREQQRIREGRFLDCMERVDAALDKAEHRLPGQATEAATWLSYALQAAGELQRELTLYGAAGQVSRMTQSTVDAIAERFNLLTWRCLEALAANGAEAAELEAEELERRARVAMVQLTRPEEGGPLRLVLS